MKNFCFILIIALLIQVPEINAQSNRHGLAFLKVGISARALGMGDAYSPIADDPTSIFYNPASLSYSNKSKLLLTHRSWIMGTTMNFIGASSNFKNFNFGIGLNTTSIPNIELRSKPGPPDGTFSAKYTAIGLGLSYKFYSFSIGASSSLLYEKIYINESSGFCTNFGIIYYSPWNALIGVSLNNLGSMNPLDMVDSKLPSRLRFGVSYPLELENIYSKLMLVGEALYSLSNESQYVHLGMEFDYNNIIAFRTGYQMGYEAKSFSTGIGIRYNIVQLDYSFIPFKYNLGTSHIFSLSIDLD